MAATRPETRSQPEKRRGNGMDIIIRHYHESDFGAVCAIEGEGLHEPYTQAVFIRQAGELFPDTFFVAECDGAVAGYAIGALVQTPATPAQAWIIRIKLRRERQGKGMGKKLLEILISTLKGMGVTEVLLSVSPANQPALHLYEKYGFRENGFKKTGMRAAYFGEGEDRCIMKRVTGVAPESSLPEKEGQTDER